MIKFCMIKSCGKPLPTHRLVCAGKCVYDQGRKIYIKSACEIQRNTDYQRNRRAKIKANPELFKAKAQEKENKSIYYPERKAPVIIMSKKKCLRCCQNFNSIGRFNRICPTCESKNARTYYKECSIGTGLQNISYGLDLISAAKKHN
jgi:hypothetical protein